MREIWIFKYCWKRRREQPEHLSLTQLLPNSSSLPHQSFGFLTMQDLCTLLLLSMPLPFPVKAEGTRGTLESNQTPYIKQEENIQSYFNLLKEPWFKSAVSLAISISLEGSVIRRWVRYQGVGLMTLDESSCGYCHKPAACTRTSHFTLRSLSLFFSYLMISWCRNGLEMYKWELLGKTCRVVVKVMIMVIT